MSNQITELKHSAQQLALIKRTVAAGLSDDEFSMFVELAKRNRLDPFRGQVSPIVFNAKKADKRRVALVVGIDGLRAIADRLGTYAPDEEPPAYVYRDDLKGDTNPLGIESCTVYCNKQRGDRWFRIPGVAHWSEFAPVQDEWGWDDQTGKRKPTGKQTVGGKWAEMPRHMIAIAAERQALRKGWPDSFGDLYAPEEVAREDMDPIQAIREVERDNRAARIGGRGIMFQFDPQEPLETVKVGEAHDRLEAWIRDVTIAARLEWFVKTNAAALKQYWSEDADGCLDIRNQIQARLDELKAGAE
jgi:phage recombination protein Bet